MAVTDRSVGTGLEIKRQMFVFIRHVLVDGHPANVRKMRHLEPVFRRFGRRSVRIEQPEEQLVKIKIPPAVVVEHALGALAAFPRLIAVPCIIRRVFILRGCAEDAHGKAGLHARIIAQIAHIAKSHEPRILRIGIQNEIAGVLEEGTFEHIQLAVVIFFIIP